MEIGWGDNFVNKINRGISESRYMLLCLSENFIKSNWSNSEFTSMFSIQNSEGHKKVLPLILNSKMSILQKYPLLNSIQYRDIVDGLDSICNDLVQLINPDFKTVGEESFQVFVESKYSGKQFEFVISKNASFKFLIDRILNTMGLEDSVDIGASSRFHLKWVLVDSTAELKWKQLERWKQRDLIALINGGSRLIKAYDKFDKLEDYRVYNGIKFFIYPVQDDYYDPPPACLPDDDY